MNPAFLEHYSQIEAIKIEVEAMKAANDARTRRGESQAYTEDEFMKRAVEMHNITNWIRDTRNLLS